MFSRIKHYDDKPDKLHAMEVQQKKRLHIKHFVKSSPHKTVHVVGKLVNMAMIHPLTYPPIQSSNTDKRMLFTHYPSYNLRSESAFCFTPLLSILQYTKCHLPVGVVNTFYYLHKPFTFFSCLMHSCSRSKPTPLSRPLTHLNRFPHLWKIDTVSQCPNEHFLCL